MPQNNAINAPLPLSTTQGGLGLASPTAHGILVAEGASPVTPIVLTNGQLLIGSTGANPVPSTLTAGTDIVITNNAGSITIDATGLGSLPWTTEGDMLYYTAGAGARLPIGPNLSILHSNGTDPEWYSQAYDDGLTATDGSVGFGTGSLATSPTINAANAAFGFFALGALVSGENNSAFGCYALSDNATGTDNTAMGLQALSSLTTGGTCSAFGSIACDDLTTASDVSAFGFQALTSASTGGSLSCAFGSFCLDALVTGITNNAFGYESLTNATNTNDNCAFGTESLFLYSGVGPCSAFGNSALSSLTSGVRNSALGFLSLEFAATASDCSAFGDHSLNALTIADNNSVFGASAGRSLTTGTGNSLFGFQAGNGGAVSNSDNAAFGVNALQTLTGDRNSAFGSNAFSVTTGSDNTSIGYSAGALNTNYTQCTFIGSNADASANSLTNACAIGYNSRVGVSNAIVLGNGCFVGIGQNSPAYALHLGTANSSLPLLYMASTAVPSTPATANDGIFSVNAGKPKFTSGTTQYQGTISTFITTGPAATAGNVLLNGTAGVTVNTTAITLNSIVAFGRTSGSVPPILANIGSLVFGNIVENTSFTIYSTNASDAGNCRWMIINP